jgi:cyclopropane fatty-acyl-phospholipid synthase-like methyltransferase
MASLDNSAAYLAPHLTSGTSVLDLGCGIGDGLARDRGLGHAPTVSFGATVFGITLRNKVIVIK